MRDILARLQEMNLKKLVFALGTRGSSTIFSFLLLWTAGQALSIDQYGLYVFLFSVGTALGLTMVLGQSIFAIKHFRADIHRPGETNYDVLRHNAKWLGFGQALLFAAAAISYFASGYFPEPYDQLYLAFLFAIAFSLGEYFISYYRVTNRLGLSLIPRENVWRALSALLVGVCIWQGINLSGEAAFILVSAVLFAAVGYQLAFFLRTEGLAWLRAAASTMKGGADRKTWTQESKYFSASLFIFAAEGYLATIVIGLVIGLEEAAVFFVTLRIAMLLSLPNVAIETITIPRISTYIQNRDLVGAQRIVSTHSAAAFGLALLGYAFLALFGGWFLWIFDPSFTAAKLVLMVVAANVVLDTFVGPATWLLMISGAERRMLKIQIGLLTIHLALMALLGAYFGILGVAIAGTIVNIIGCLVTTYGAMRYAGADPMAISIFRPFLLGGSRLAEKEKRKQDRQMADLAPHPAE